MKRITLAAINDGILHAKSASAVGIRPELFHSYLDIIDRTSDLIDRIRNAAWTETRTRTFDKPIISRVSGAGQRSTEIVLPALLFIELMEAVRLSLFNK